MDRDGAGAYAEAGVAGQGDALTSVGRHLGPTLGLPPGAEVLTPFGHFASVVKVSPDLAIALCTDGVGTKTMIAAMLDRYDTIGFDCVAMNVNDLICVGARPVAMLDYLGVNTLDERRTDEILEGLGAAATAAGIAIPGGEIAQLPEVIGSNGRVPGDVRAFDLVGSCFGTLRPDRMILGDDISPGDAIIGIASSGIHSNGLTLARRVLVTSGDALHRDVYGLGRALGDELLVPTTIYVAAIAGLWDAGIETRGLAHVTGDGLTNVCRLNDRVGYDIEALPRPPTIFEVIQRTGAVSNEDMFRVFNMGVGFVVITPDAEADAACRCIGDLGYRCLRMGPVTTEAGCMRIVPARLVGRLEGGVSRLQPA